MNPNTRRNTATRKAGEETKATLSFGNRAPLAEHIDIQRALHDDYDIRSCPMGADAPRPLRISDEHYDHHLF
ncbi:hypothetical protein L0Y65_02005 [Candidatus Micrarchaeota archaeon]|nr:hypothetical protein [Candidatus Micrarchaeota archaeon]